MRGFLLIALLPQFGVAQAANVTVDFEEFAGIGQAPLVFESKDYTFTQTSGLTGVLDSPIGDNVSFFFCPEAECNGQQDAAFKMEASNGALFDLTSMDLGFVEADPFPTTITGVLSDYTTISVELGSLGGWFDTVNFDSSWSGLKSVSVNFETEGNYLFNVPGVDNIVASVVPVPAAVWLFGSALAGLGWMRRKQTA